MIHWAFHLPLSKFLAAFAVALILIGPAVAQDDVTTRNGPSSYGGGFITGPASNPLSFLNGPAYRTFGSPFPYVLPDTKPATLLNRQLPRCIVFGIEERLRIERDDDTHALNRLRVQMDLKPTSWLKIVTQVQDARVIKGRGSAGPPDQVTWDLKLAYAEFGSPEPNGISLRVGRQVINYNNTIVANSEWRNQGRSYDAVVLNLHYERLRTGIFAASVVTPAEHGLTHHRQGNNLYGIYNSIDAIGRSTLEPFILWRIAPSRDVKALGVRYKGLLTDRVEYSFEGIYETISASAYTGGAAYRFANTTWTPRIFWQSDWASRTFDTMYPTAHDRFGIADQFGWQNIVSHRGGLTIEPLHRWTVTFGYQDVRLASAKDPLFNSSGSAIVRDPTGRSGTHVAGEFDTYTWFELNRHLNIGAGLGYVSPRDFLIHNGRTGAFVYPYFAVNFKDVDQAN